MSKPKAAVDETTAVTVRNIADDARAWADTIEGLVGVEGNEESMALALQAQAQAIRQGKDKVESFVWFVKRLATEQAFLKTERDRLKKRQDVLAAAEAGLRQYALQGMQANQLKVLEGNTCALSVVGTAPAVVLADEGESVPIEFKSAVIQIALTDWERICKRAGFEPYDQEATGARFDEFKVDKKAIAAALKVRDVEGADLKIDGETLRIT